MECKEPVWSGSVNKYDMKLTQCHCRARIYGKVRYHKIEITLFFQLGVGAEKNIMVYYTLTKVG